MKKLMYIAAISLAAASCSSSDTWTVQGTVEGAGDSLLVLEESHSGRWIPVDSVRLDAQGSFKFRQKSAGYPDVYRLAVGNDRVYFPIDSTNSVVVNARYPGIATSGTISGSVSADKMQRVNQLINKAMATSGAAVVTDSVLKHELADIILEDASGVVAYYIINKEVAGHPLYDPLDKGDLRVIGAVANAFKAFRPDDPRTRYMEELFIAARRAQSTSRNTVEATEITYLPLNLTARDGQRLSLSEVVGKGRPVIVNFTAYAAEGSPAINVALSNVYRNGGVDIYQVSVDTDEYLWRQASAALPWHTVLMLPADGNRPLVDYNVSAIPATFVIDANGVLQERVFDLTDLQSVVNKYK